MSELKRNGTQFKPLNALEKKAVFGGSAGEGTGAPSAGEGTGRQ